ncbi:malto-oligosyltrehalose trehalohydrolase [Spirosoma sp. KCTC 42546]|uniref:malto-oligosyltrehalose trehalohydrolase n=1 Tax=Spirosoma sp. KCTC 42546 TaxID=2520506 RepID=UPI00115778D5|nr:malto-oligosyltrehalose trehalohydrolase [Spirosoma sp. KCTC 42546]QDK82762.1 malto-oligosyltrehalose trehalohydrolase [Spirosoma sp. KCTC 42546]
MNQALINRRTLGVTFTADTTCVRVWAPLAQSVDLRFCNRDVTVPLQNDGNYWQAAINQLQPGDTYKFVLNGTMERPDPASLAQPEGVHGPSQAVDLAKFAWTDANWQNLPLEDYLIYELHTGTFTPEGTFAGIESRLDYLLELGINTVEIMPVAQFPGTRNWGYDGVCPYAVQYSYGGAAGLQQLVDICHRKGLAVVLDVVYNHMGPEGNYFADFGPYFTTRYQTPWGNALNFDGDYSDSVRRYFVENVLMWFRDFHIDALRIDAAHAIHDARETHLLREIKQYVDELMQQTGQIHYLIVESDQNETRFIQSLADMGYGMDAQWNDEFHHALRVAAGGERKGYYADYNGIQHLAKSYKDAYVYDGTYMPRRARIVGKSTAGHAGRQFVVFSQNHDHIGNRMLGERPSQLVSFDMQKLMAGAVISSPYLPMLFMGEEWGELNPFLYFVSHSDPALIDAVREGRKREFAAFQASVAEGSGLGVEAPVVEATDAQDERTFERSKLQWARLTKEPHQTLFRYYQTLLALRKHSSLRHPNRESVAVVADEIRQTLTLFRQHKQPSTGQTAEPETVVCLMNFSKEPRSLLLAASTKPWQKLLDSADPKWRGPLSAPQLVAGNESVVVQPESILIYTNQSNLK